VGDGVGVGVFVGDGVGVGVFVGGAVTTTLKLPDVVLPARSLTEQFTAVVPGANSEPDAGVHVGVSAPSTPSLAVAEKLTFAPAELFACTEIVPGNVKVGFSVSSTVTVKLPVPVLPALSIAVHVTVVARTGKTDPDAGVHDTPTLPSTMSAAEAEKLTAAPFALPAGTVMFDGTLTTGGVVSTTETLNVRVVALPALSVTLHVTLAVPRPKVVPERGVHVGVSGPSTASVADAVKVTAAPEAPVASALNDDGTVNTGPVVSRTKTLNEPVAGLPALSVARHDTVVVPSGNVVPARGVQATSTLLSTLSVAVALKLTTAPDLLAASIV
jgi:hypothetical protein